MMINYTVVKKEENVLWRSYSTYISCSEDKEILKGMTFGSNENAHKAVNG